MKVEEPCPHLIGNNKIKRLNEHLTGEIAELLSENRYKPTGRVSTSG